MKTDTSLIPDPRSLPANANLPAVNQPATLVGVTIAFLVCASWIKDVLLILYVLTI